MSIDEMLSNSVYFDFNCPITYKGIKDLTNELDNHK